MGITKKIAVLCNYELIPERVGGMDYFYWLFDKNCKEKNITVDWFFPNKSSHGEYSSLTIFSSEYKNVENFFLENYAVNNYSHVVLHFVELCTPFYKKLKSNYNPIIIAVDHNPRPLLGYSFKKKIEKKLKGILYSKYIDLFVGVSNYTVNEIIKDFGFQLRNKTTTIYNGVVIENIKERKARNFFQPTFLVASHLRKSKGIQDLIQAVALLPKELIDKITIDIYGDGPYKSNLEEKVKKHNLQEKIIFKGNKPNLNEIFFNYDYMLQPTYMECFSLSILESLAANVPVITTSVGGNEEAIKNNENGYIFKAKDYEQLKKILEKLLLEKIKITTNTRELIKHEFSLEKMVNNHIKLLQ